MTLELEEAIKDAQNGDLQEAVLKLCEVVRLLQDEILYLQGSQD